MNRIFISYAHKDASEVAEWLFQRLIGCGYEVWKDNHSLSLGSSFPREISDAVEQQDAFIVLLSAAAVASSWVQEEIEMAKVARRRLIPIILGEIEIPLYLRTIHSLKISAEGEDWRSLHHLVNQLEGGEAIPRVYNLSGHKDIEVSGVLVLGHSGFGLVDLSSPASITETAVTLAQAALPYIKEARAGIVPHGHPALACSILAHLLGTTNQMPSLFYTYRLENGKFGISSDKVIALQDLRDLGFAYRKNHH